MCKASAYGGSAYNYIYYAFVEPSDTKGGKDIIVVCYTGHVKIKVSLTINIMIGYRTWFFNIVPIEGEYYTKAVDGEVLLFTDEDCLEQAVLEYDVADHNFDDLEIYNDHYDFELQFTIKQN